MDKWGLIKSDKYNNKDHYRLSGTAYPGKIDGKAGNK